MGVGGALVGTTVGAVGGTMGGTRVETWATAAVEVGSGAGAPEPANVQASDTANHIARTTKITLRRAMFPSIKAVHSLVIICQPGECATTLIRTLLNIRSDISWLSRCVAKCHMGFVIFVTRSDSGLRVLLPLKQPQLVDR
jgi:hypothetical protein